MANDPACMHFTTMKTGAAKAITVWEMPQSIQLRLVRFPMR